MMYEPSRLYCKGQIDQWGCLISGAAMVVLMDCRH